MPEIPDVRRQGLLHGESGMIGTDRDAHWRSLSLCVSVLTAKLSLGQLLFSQSAALIGPNRTPFFLSHPGRSAISCPCAAIAIADFQAEVRQLRGATRSRDCFDSPDSWCETDAA